MNKNLDFIAALERAILEKYGELAIKNPKSEWSSEKEQEYINSSKQKLLKDAQSENTSQAMEIDGVLVSKKLINSNKRTCKYCNIYSFNRNDDLFFTKFEACYKCYIEYIEGREERWKNGWRPSKTEHT